MWNERNDKKIKLLKTWTETIWTFSDSHSYLSSIKNNGCEIALLISVHIHICQLLHTSLQVPVPFEVVSSFIWWGIAFMSWRFSYGGGRARILAFYTRRVFSLPIFQFKSVNISTILTSKQKCVYIWKLVSWLLLGIYILHKWNLV